MTLPGDGVDAHDGAALAQTLFSEAPGRVLVSVTPQRAEELARRCADAGIGAVRLGSVGGDALTFTGVADLPLDVLVRTHVDALPAALGELAVAGTVTGAVAGEVGA